MAPGFELREPEIKPMPIAGDPGCDGRHLQGAGQNQKLDLCVYLVYTIMMASTEAVETIVACVDADQYTVRQHVYDRLAERHLMAPDLLSILGDPSSVRGDGVDQHGRDRWFLSGTLHDAATVEVLVLIDPRPHVTVFTVYWID